jgi:hypothetical protein
VAVPSTEEWDRELSLVMRANRDLKMAQVFLQRQVDAARRHGHSWAAIGFALGTSRQAAQQRFGRTGDPGPD